MLGHRQALLGPGPPRARRARRGLLAAATATGTGTASAALGWAARRGRLGRPPLEGLRGAEGLAVGLLLLPPMRGLGCGPIAVAVHRAVQSGRQLVQRAPERDGGRGGLGSGRGGRQLGPRRCRVVLGQAEAEQLLGGDPDGGEAALQVGGEQRGAAQAGELGDGAAARDGGLARGERVGWGWRRVD